MTAHGPAPARRTPRTATALDAARQEGVQVILSGPGVHDLLVTDSAHSLRLDGFLLGYCADRSLGLVTYSLARGAVTHPTLPDGQAVAIRPAARDDHPAVAVERVIDDLSEHDGPAVLVFESADLVLRREGSASLEIGLLVELLQRLAADASSQRAGRCLVLVDGGGGLPRQLVDHPGFREITVGHPDAAEATVFIERACAARATAPLHLAAGLSPAEAGRRAGGLLNLHVNRLRLASSAASPVTADQISAEKEDAIRAASGGALEVMPCWATFTDGVAGLASVRRAVDAADLAGRNTLRLLLAGPAGTGKSLAATALAQRLRVPAVKYGEILNEYVGVAERNLARAHDVLRAMAPLVLFIDEADQAGLGARGAAGHTSEVHQNLRAALFTFLGDTGADCGISVVAATNVPGRMDSAALSRFDVVPVLFASPDELARIVAVHALRGGVPLDDDLPALVRVLEEHADKGRVLSGRSAVRLLRSGHDEALRRGDRCVRAGHVRVALQRRVADDWTPAAEYSTLTALLAADDTHAWPWVAAGLLGEPARTPRYLAPYDNGEGSLDAAKMRQRVATLEASGVYG